MSEAVVDAIRDQLLQVATTHPRGSKDYKRVLDVTGKLEKVSRERGREGGREGGASEFAIGRRI